MKGNIRIRRTSNGTIVEAESGSWAVTVDQGGIPTFVCRNDRGYGLIEDWPEPGVDSGHEPEALA